MRRLLKRKPPLGEGERDRESHAATALGIIVALQLFTLLDATDGNTLPIGTWTTYEPAMYFYMAIETLAIAYLLFNRDKPASDYRGGWARLTTNFSLGQYGIRAAIAGFALWVAFSALYASHIANLFGPFASQSSTGVIQGLLWYFVWVGGAETIVFQSAALSFFKRGAVILAAAVATLGHLPAYFTTATNYGAQALETELLELFLIFVMLNLVYQRWGFAATQFLHGTYDAIISGFIAPLF